MTSVGEYKAPSIPSHESHLANRVGQSSLRSVEVGRRVGVLYSRASPTELSFLMRQKCESDF